MAETLQQALFELAQHWERLAEDARTEGTKGYAEGYAAAFERAAKELIELAWQLAPIELDPRATADIQIVPLPESVTDEYLYVRLEMSNDGVWRVHSLNGIRQAHWERGESFEQLVGRLSEKGWRLVRFAKGIHIFKRLQDSQWPPNAPPDEILAPMDESEG